MYDITNDRKLFHGTSKKSKEHILSDRKFFLSNKENEWAGTGIYFFIDDKDDVAEDNARKWSTCIKKVKESDLAVIVANVKTEEINLFDLTERELQQIFHYYREEMYKKAVSCAKLRNKRISNTYKDKLKFDCHVINHLCNYFNFNVVIRDVYINFNKNILDGEQYPNSGIPNCTICCLRTNDIIDKIK